MLARGPHLPQTFAVQVAQRRERAQEEQHKAERSVAGRVCQVLLPEDRSRQGEHLLLSLAFSTSLASISILLRLSDGLPCLEHVVWRTKIIMGNGRVKEANRSGITCRFLALHRAVLRGTIERKF